MKQLINEARRMQQLAGLLNETESADNLEEGSESEWEITGEDKIEGATCVDFNPTELQAGDTIYKRLVDVVNYKSKWAKDVNKISPGGMASHSTADKYNVVSNDGKVLKLKEE
jgi:hypothetical protein